jgi:hypothetical protein
MYRPQDKREMREDRRRCVKLQDYSSNFQFKPISHMIMWSSESAVTP